MASLCKRAPVGPVGSQGAPRAAVVTRASRLEQTLCVAAANLLATSQALAEMTAPSMTDLKAYQATYDAAGAQASNAAASASLSASAAGLEALSGDDMAPLLAGLAAGIALVGGGIATLARETGPSIKLISAVKAYELLSEDPAAQLLDVRLKADKSTGTPDLKSLKKAVSALPWTPGSGGAPPTTGTVVVGWPQKFGRLSKFSEDSVVVILDADGREGAAAAKAVAEVYPNSTSVYYVNGGAEGWQANELPWAQPFSLKLDMDLLKSVDFTGVAKGTDELMVKYKENPTPVNAIVATAAVAGASVFLFAELETILQVVGILAAGQFLARKLLFAEDRQQTFSDIKSLINEKIGAEEAGSDLRQLAATILDSETADDLIETVSTESPSTQSTSKEAPSTESPSIEPTDIGVVGSVPGAAPVSAEVQSAEAWIDNWRKMNA